jgi:hypothetical protein
MKPYLKFTTVAVFAVAATAFTACKHFSGSLFSKPHSAFVDSAHFTNADVADVANEVDIFTREALKADTQMDHNSVADNDALMKKMHDEMLSLQPRLDSTSSKLVSAVSNLPKTPASLTSPEIKEMMKWQDFMGAEAKILDKVKHKSLRF